MKKILSGCIALLCTTLSWADNGFSIDEFTIEANSEAIIQIKMNNDITFSGFQFDLELPEGVSIMQDQGNYVMALTNRCIVTNVFGQTTQTHTYVCTLQSSGAYRVMVYSGTNANITGTSGDPVLYVQLTASDQVATGTFTPKFTNIVMSQADETQYKPEDCSYTCNVTLSTKVTTLGYASFSWPKAIDFSESGLTAFIAKNCTGSSLKLVPVTKVPANTGLILKGEAGSDNTYQLQTTEEETDDVSENILSSNTEDIYEVASDDIYVLSNLNDGQPGFYRAAQGIHVGQYKSYLQYSSSQSIELYFDEEETTGISIISNSQPTADGKYYDLQGRRVSHPTTGVYILNGKKIIVK